MDFKTTEQVYKSLIEEKLLEIHDVCATHGLAILTAVHFRGDRGQSLVSIGFNLEEDDTPDLFRVAAAIIDSGYEVPTNENGGLKQ